MTQSVEFFDNNAGDEAYERYEKRFCVSDPVVYKSRLKDFFGFGAEIRPNAWPSTVYASPDTIQRLKELGYIKEQQC